MWCYVNKTSNLSKLASSSRVLLLHEPHCTIGTKLHAGFERKLLIQHSIAFKFLILATETAVRPPLRVSFCLAFLPTCEHSCLVDLRLLTLTL